MIVPPLDLSNVNSLRNQNLTPEQGNQRYTILSQLEEELDGQGKSLSPKSQKELKQLSELVEKGTNEVLTGSFAICRLTTAHYRIVYPSAEAQKIEKYKKLGSCLSIIPKSSMGVLQAIQPGTTDNWFYEAMKNHINSVFRTDFVNALRFGFIANINLIRSSAMLTKEPKIFKEVLKIYKDSTDIYEHQVTFNRSVEKNLIESAQTSHRRLEDFHGEILEICGPKLQPNEKVFKSCKTFHDNELEKSLALYTKLEMHCGEFVKKIENLNGSVTNCIATISSKHETVMDALSRMNGLILKRQEINEELSLKRRQLHEEMTAQRNLSNEEMKVKRHHLEEQRKRIEKEYQHFQQSKSKEDVSRRIETKTDKKEGGFWFFSWESTTTTSEVHEADFGSKETYQTFLKLKSEGATLELQTANREAELNKKIREREAELNKSLWERETKLNAEILNAQNALTQAMLTGGILQYGIDQTSMEQAVSCLTSASAALTQLEIALNIRRSQAKNQIEACKKDLGTVEFRNLPHILAFLEDLTAEVVHKQFLALESNRQVMTIQDCRQAEQVLQLEIANALSLSATDPDALQNVSKKIGAFLPSIDKKPEDIFVGKLIDDKKMLQLMIEGNLS